MKKLIKNIIVTLLVVSVTFIAFAQQAGQKVEFDEFNKNEFGIRVDEGLSLTKINRIVEQTERSNYRFEDIYVGAYVDVKTTGFKTCNPFIRIAGYYPYQQKFNDMQVQINEFNFAADLMAGLCFDFSFWDYVFLNLVPSFHYGYEYTDRFAYMNIGGGLVAQVELPISYEWTIVLNGIGTVDYGNHGSNRLIEPYDFVWQETVDIGVRWSKKQVNKYNYLGQTAESVAAAREAKLAKAKAKVEAAKAKMAKPAKEKAQKPAPQKQEVKKAEPKKQAPAKDAAKAKKN